MTRDELRDKLVDLAVLSVYDKNSYMEDLVEKANLYAATFKVPLVREWLMESRTVFLNHDAVERWAKSLP